MKIYTHLSLDDMDKIYSLYADGISSRKIATAIGRTTSTVSREIKRNTSKVVYLPDRAQSILTFNLLIMPKGRYCN